MLATALTDVSMTGIVSEITGVLPIVLPVVITVLAVRKGVGFLMGALRGC